MKMSSRSNFSDVFQNGHFAGFPVHSLDRLNLAFENIFKSSARMSAETVRFVTMRLEEDLKLSSDLAKCGSSVDVVQTNMKFLEKMMRDYAEEAQVMFNLAQSEAQNNLTEVEKLMPTDEAVKKRPTARASSSN